MTVDLHRAALADNRAGHTRTHALHDAVLRELSKIDKKLEKLMSDLDTAYSDLDKYFAEERAFITGLEAKLGDLVKANDELKTQVASLQGDHAAVTAAADTIEKKIADARQFLTSQQPAPPATTPGTTPPAGGSTPAPPAQATPPVTPPAPGATRSAG